MSDTFHKFLFLGAMIVLVVFANRGTVAKQDSLKLTYGVIGQRQIAKEPPVFVLQSPSAIASNNAEANISSNQAQQSGGGASVSASAGNKTVIPGSGSTQFSSQNALLETSGDSSQSVFLKRGSDPAPDIGARIAFVADFGSATQYVSFNAESNWPLASLTKLMTAVIALKNIGLDQKITVTPEAFAADPSDQLLKIGDTYSASDLLRIMLLPSSNVAAETIARSYPATAEAGARDDFISAMNAQAAAWGMTGTHFDDPSGISVSSRSDAHDLFILAKGIYTGYHQIFTITKVASAYVTELNSGKRVLVKSIDNFAGRADFVGGKTGHTDEAGGNLLSVFSYQRKPLFIVVMGTDDRFGDTQKLLEWFETNYK